MEGEEEEEQQVGGRVHERDNEQREDEIEYEVNQNQITMQNNRKNVTNRTYKHNRMGGLGHRWS